MEKVTSAPLLGGILLLRGMPSAFALDPEYEAGLEVRVWEGSG